MKKEKNSVKLWNKDFIIIIAVNFLVFLNHLMILSTFPFFISYLGYSDSVSGMCATLFSFIAVICRPFVGWILDNGKRKAVLVVGLCGMALMPMGYLLVYTALSSIALAVVLRMAHGISLACSNTSTSTIATDIIPKQRFSEGMGMFGMATALATACAPAIGEMLMNKSFTLLFIVASVIMLISLILIGFLKTPKLDIEKKPFSFKGLIDKNALPASAVVLIFLLTYGALENYTLKFADESSQITLSGGLYFTIMAVTLFLTRVLIGKVADQKGEAIFVYTCNVCMLVALLLIAIVPNNITFLISAALSGYAFGGIEPSLQAMAVNISTPQERGAANSTFLCAYDIGIGLGGGIAGVLIDAVGYNKMFTIIALANVLSVIVYVLWGRKHPSSITYRIKHNLNK
ncbi:MAG: MFS transporter [Clostridiales bacterium]|nr:MFS transporter [Clostridiales bacterium]